MMGFSRLCYHLVRTGNIKISAILSTNQETGINTLSFPDLGDVTIDMDRAETFGLMTVSIKRFNSNLAVLLYYLLYRLSVMVYLFGPDILHYHRLGKTENILSASSAIYLWLSI